MEEREREGERQRKGGQGRGGEGKKLFDLKVMRLRRDQNPGRCTSQRPHKVFQNSATVYTPEADEMKTFSTSSCLIELVHVMGGSCFSEPK